MNDTEPQSALREWRAHFSEPARLAALLGAAVILAIMAPFSTGEAMRGVPRFAYWLALIVLSYAAGFAANQVAARAAPASLVRRIAVAGPLTAIIVIGLVYILNGLALSYWPSGADLVIQAVNIAAISIVVAAIFQIAYNQGMDSEDESAVPTPLLDRIAFEKRAPLVSISVEDHYVRIRTTKGEDMILMRLSDAIREVGTTPGLQVHRSHWVALAQVTAAVRKGDGAVLTMTHGPDIPVSRANVQKIKEAGLLPR
ncbi:MAG: LytTR family transcriptional regulator DNA-binding domain-containing protein [Pseudomonadota bacterium]